MDLLGWGFCVIIWRLFFIGMKNERLEGENWVEGGLGGEIDDDGFGDGAGGGDGGDKPDA